MVRASLSVWHETQPALFASASAGVLGSGRRRGADQAVVARHRLLELGGAQLRALPIIAPPAATRRSVPPVRLRISRIAISIGHHGVEQDE
jgi:hypothetical protein